MSNFAFRLRRLRERKGLTQKEIATHFQLAESTVSMYEQGKREPDFDLLERLADFFEVTVDYLIGRSDKRNHTSTIETEPEVQVIMRAKEEMSPKAFARFLKHVELAKKTYVEEDDE